MSDISLLSGISGLSFDSTLLSPFLLPAPIALSVLSSFFFFCLLPHSSDFLSRKFFNIFL